MTSPRIIAVIPAHMASARFPGKILFDFFGHPMIEHVRRRALLSPHLDEVYVATCDQVIADTVKNYGGNVIMTGDHHLNGTTRVAEAVADIDCSHVILLQGDEPLLQPDDVSSMVEAISADSGGDAWNATAFLKTKEEMDRHSFVKCAVGAGQRIHYCFRRSPSHAPLEEQQRYIRKILGLIAFRKAVLMELVETAPSIVEEIEFIEQMRIIDKGFRFKAVDVDQALPSVNEPHEANLIVDYLKAHSEQQALLKETFSISLEGEDH